MKRVFALVLLLLPALAQPVARELKATVVGDGVGQSGKQEENEGKNPLHGYLQRTSGSDM